MRWLYRLENKFGRHYIRNLMTIIVGGMVVVYLLDIFLAAGGISVVPYLSLDRAAILSGQVWRLVTFLFVYPSDNVILLLLNLYIYYIMGRMLENSWGGFRLNVYYLLGIIGAWAAMFLTGGASSYYLNMSLFLAFATIASETTFMLFFILPIKAKWLAIGYAALMGFELVQTFVFSGISAGLRSLVVLAFSLLNYAVFFGPALVNAVKEQMRISRNRRNWRNNWK